MVDQTNRFQCVSQQTEPEPRIELRPRSGDSSFTLDAAELIEQYAVSATDTLLVLDDDCPYEERLHLVLMRNDSLIDYIEIGAMYVPGIFDPIDHRDRELRFRFESDAIWTLTISQTGRGLFGGLPSGARRRTGLLAKRYMFLGFGEGE